jgi:hypothetical protein
MKHNSVQPSDYSQTSYNSPSLGGFTEVNVNKSFIRAQPYWKYLDVKNTAKVYPLYCYIYHYLAELMSNNIT